MEESNFEVKSTLLIMMHIHANNVLIRLDAIQINIYPQYVLHLHPLILPHLILDLMGLANTRQRKQLQGPWG